MKELPTAAALLGQLVTRIFVGHSVAFGGTLFLASVVVPTDAEALRGHARLAGWVGGASLVVHLFIAFRFMRFGEPLRSAIAARRSRLGAPPPPIELVRSTYLLPNQTGYLAISAVCLAALVDTTGVLSISLMGYPEKLALALVCLGVFESVTPFIMVPFRRHLWEWLREIPPEDVRIYGHHRFGERLGSRVLSAALVPPLVSAAYVLGRPGVTASRVECAHLAAIGIGLVGLFAVFLAFQMGRLAERDVRALVNHVDDLLARGSLRSETVSEWGEQSMSTRAAIELVDSIHLLAARYARLASAEEHASRAVEEAHMLRTRFMAYMSHDLRSPLNSITGFAEVLAMESEGPLSEEQRESVLTIRESGQDLVRLVTNIVDAARLEAGRLAVYLAWTPAAELVDEVVARVQRPGASQIAPIRVHIEPGLPAVRADAERMVQVLSTILLHLLREAEEEPVSIRLSVRRWDRDGDAPQVLFEIVSRTRLGADQYARIVEGNRRVAAIGGQHAGGLGIAFSLCRSLVLAQEGRLWCESNEDRETRFRIALRSAPLA